MSQELMPTDALLKRCSQAWGLSELRFVRKMENIVFECRQGGTRLFLRLTTPLRRSRAEIEAELDWIEHLDRVGICVPKIVEDSQGNKIGCFSDATSHFEAVVFKAIDGQHPSKKMAQDRRFLKQLGVLIAQMHQANLSASYKKIVREKWCSERGIRHALSAAECSDNYELCAAFHESISWMGALEQSDETYGLVHADLGAMNLFIKEDHSIAVIDFDDSCYHFFAFDIAIVIFSMANRFGHIQRQSTEETWLEALLEGYRLVRNFTDEQEMQIPQFIDFACRRLYFWIEYHEKLGTFHKDSLQAIAMLKQWAAARGCQKLMAKGS